MNLEVSTNLKHLNLVKFTTVVVENPQNQDIGFKTHACLYYCAQRILCIYT